jgi:hypothetical protein
VVVVLEKKVMKYPLVAFGAALALAPLVAAAHHGVAGLGAAGLEGPGAPIEQSSSATLPKGKVFTYFKMDYANWKTYTPPQDDEAESATFWMAGLGLRRDTLAVAVCLSPLQRKGQ